MSLINDYFKGDFDAEVTIHPQEYDTDFVVKLRRMLEAHFEAGFSKPEHIGPVGSQEFMFLQFNIGRDSLLLKTETYMGISLIGPSPIVNTIVSIVGGEWATGLA